MGGRSCAPAIPGGQHCWFHLSSGKGYLEVSARPASFPVFSDSARGTVLYRAPAAACNACPSKAACTDSSQGREIERSDLNGLEYGMKRFQRAVSLTLLVLASLILVVELFRTGGLYPRIVLASALTLFCVLIGRLSAKLSQGVQSSQSPQNVDV